MFSGSLLVILLIIQNQLIIDSCCAPQTLYDVLQVKRTATDEEIRKAYKQLSLKYHPDKNKEVSKEEAENIFSAIANAYEILGNKEKRQDYDATLQSQDESNGPGGTSDNTQARRRRKKQKKEKEPGNPSLGVLQSSLEDLYNGVVINLTVSHRRVCSKCRGTGAHRGEIRACPRCHGRGFFVQQMDTPQGPLQIEKDCAYCDGTGSVIGKKCKMCKGTKTVKVDEDIPVYVEPGMTTGDEMSYQELGEEMEDTTKGHLYLAVLEDPHPLFTRDGDDLHVTKNISLRQALEGFSFILTHLDGKPLTINRTNEITPPSFELTIKGEGMPKKQVFSSLSAEQIQTFHRHSENWVAEEDQTSLPLSTASTMPASAPSTSLFSPSFAPSTPSAHPLHLTFSTSPERQRCFGDLHIHFNVDFPSTLTPAQLTAFTSNFPSPSLPPLTHSADSTDNSIHTEL